MNIKGKSTTQQCDDQETKSDITPLIALFELLLEWDMKDVQEKEAKRKEVS
jgi:hypothetical protein